MSEIYMLMTVAKRSVGRRLLACYEKIGLSSILCTLAQGTATSETLDYFGLEVTEKMVTLTVVSNHGHSEEVMEAARAEGAGGGTVIHAKGTGLERAEKFLGVSIADEKELILIVTKTESKNAIMKSIMDHAGLASKARSVVFSLPVTDTAGLRLQEVQ